MTSIIETIYENGVFRPIKPLDHLQEHHHYTIIVEFTPQSRDLDPALATRIAERTSVLPDGRTSINMLGLFDDGDSGLSFEDIETILDESRQAQQQEWDELNSMED